MAQEIASVGLNKWVVYSYTRPFLQVFSTMYNNAGTVFQEKSSAFSQLPLLLWCSCARR